MQRRATSMNHRYGERAAPTVFPNAGRSVLDSLDNLKFLSRKKGDRFSFHFPSTLEPDAKKMNLVISFASDYMINLYTS